MEKDHPATITAIFQRAAHIRCGAFEMTHKAGEPIEEARVLIGKKNIALQARKKEILAFLIAADGDVVTVNEGMQSLRNTKYYGVQGQAGWENDVAYLQSIIVQVSQLKTEIGKQADFVQACRIVTCNTRDPDGRIIHGFRLRPENEEREIHTYGPFTIEKPLRAEWHQATLSVGDHVISTRPHHLPLMAALIAAQGEPVSVDKLQEASPVRSRTPLSETQRLYRTTMKFSYIRKDLSDATGSKEYGEMIQSNGRGIYSHDKPLSERNYRLVLPPIKQLVDAPHPFL